MLPMLVAAVLPAAGCGATDSALRDAREAALGFLAAVEAQDGARACALLVPDTREAVESESGRPCEEGVLELDLPSAEGAPQVEVFGEEGLVELPEQRLFVSATPLGWRVVSAGCEPRMPKKDDCEVEP